MMLDLTCKTSDLQNQGEKDNHFNNDQFTIDKEADEKFKRMKIDRTSIQKRVISHPSFHNVSFKDAERMLAKMDQVINTHILFYKHSSEDILFIICILRIIPF